MIESVSQEERQRALATPPEFTPSSPGLHQGYLYKHLAPQESVQFQSSGRTVCDVILLVTICPDGTSDVTVTHFYPEGTTRRVNQIIVDAMDQEHHHQGIRFATILTSHPSWPLFRREETGAAYDALFQTVRQFNNGKDPDVVSVDEAIVELPYISELKFSKTTPEGEPLYSFSVTGSTYYKTFSQSNASEVAKEPPVFLSIDGHLFNTQQTSCDEAFSF